MTGGTNKLQRRAFLAAVGLGVTAPLALKMSRLAVAAPGDRPTRLFIYYVPHGVPVEHFDPVGTASDIDLGASGFGILRAFEPYKRYVSVVRGLGMHDGATNHAAIRAMLTGFGDGGSVNSIDYTIAEALGVTPHALGAIPYNRGGGFTVDSYLIKHGTWVRATESPVEAADALFGNLVAPTNATVDESVFRQEALALGEQEIERLQASISGLTKEQNKLALHLESLRALKAGGSEDSTTVSCTERPTLPAVEAVRGLDVLEHANFGKILDAHLEAAAHALACGTARVVTMQNMWVNADLNFGFEGGPGIAKGHHQPISHSWDGTGRQEFAQCQHWFYQKLADKVLKVLDQPDPADPGDSTRTILDNSVILICSEVSDGANHNSDAAAELWVEGRNIGRNYLPMVLIGGGGGYLQTQQIVDVEKGRTHVDLLATVAEAMGVPLSNIGSASVRPIAELEA